MTQRKPLCSRGWPSLLPCRQGWPQVLQRLGALMKQRMEAYLRNRSRSSDIVHKWSTLWRCLGLRGVQRGHQPSWSWYGASQARGSRGWREGCGPRSRSRGGSPPGCSQLMPILWWTLTMGGSVIGTTVLLKVRHVSRDFLFGFALMPVKIWLAQSWRTLIVGSGSLACDSNRCVYSDSGRWRSVSPSFQHYLKQFYVFRSPFFLPPCCRQGA
jgi:hypothetical protein